MEKQSPAQSQNQPQKSPAQGQQPAQGQPFQQGNQGQSPAQPVQQPNPGPQGANSDLKSRIKSDFQGFNTDTDFASIKVFGVCTQGLRLRLERSKGTIHTKVFLISKKCGILRPEFLASEIKLTQKEITVVNSISKKAFLTIKHNEKSQQWDIINNDAGLNITGSIKISQNGDVRSVVYSQSTTEIARIDIKCPVQKTGMCSSAKPANLLNIGLNGKFKVVQLEENPNGESCQNDLEVNAYYQVSPDQSEFVALVALFQLLARELQ